MFEAYTSNLGLYIPLTVAFVGMLAMTVLILYKDFKHMKVTQWMLLLFVLIGFIGVIVARAVTGCFQWYFLLCIPIWFILNTLNTKLNHNKFIGQADVDIFAGTLALYVPIAIYILSFNYDSDLDFSIKAIQLGGIAMDLTVWLLIGLILTIVVTLIKFAYAKITNKKIAFDTDVNKEFLAEKEAKEKKSLGEKYDEIGYKVLEKSMGISSNKKDNKTKLRGTKVPICLSFIPVYFAAVYNAASLMF